MLTGRGRRGNRLLSGSLRLAGFDVVTAASGAAAVHAVEWSRPDLVLLDVMLPDGRWLMPM